MDVPTEAYNVNEGPIHSRWRIWCFAAPRAFVKDKGILCGLCCRSCRTSKQKIHSCFWPLAATVFHIYSGNEDENGNQLLSLFPPFLPFSLQDLLLKSGATDASGNVIFSDIGVHMQQKVCI